MIESTQLTGSVERVVFHSSESGYCVFKMRVAGKRRLVTVCGHTASLHAGETVEALGQWQEHIEFGRQFSAKSLQSSQPAHVAGTETYLSSGLIKGIGPQLARRLIAYFGPDVLNILEDEPGRLREVPGIGAGRLARLQSAWQEHKEIRQIMAFLEKHGLNSSRAVRLFRAYGADTIRLIEENPFRLSQEIHGIGFKSCDLIAGHLGLKPEDPMRLRAGLRDRLLGRLQEGHCAWPEADLLREAEELLGVERLRILASLDEEERSGRLVRETIDGVPCVYLASVFAAESEVAQALLSRRTGPPPWKERDIDRVLTSVEVDLGLRLVPLQRQAVVQALSSRVTLITGAPGSGKTTLVRALALCLQREYCGFVLAAPTGRAAKRLSETTGVEARTLHRLLGFNHAGGFLHGPDNPLPVDLILIDEASMLDLDLMRHVLRALPERAALVLVGDADQIPSVNAGQVFKSLLDCEQFTTVRLEQVFRQEETSRIRAAALRLRAGRLPEGLREPGLSDFYFIRSRNDKEIRERVCELVTRRIPQRFGFDPVREIQVLCPTNRGPIGAQILNRELQQSLSHGDPGARVEKFGLSFARGDKVMALVNDYDKEVFNGDIGQVVEVDLQLGEVVIEFDGRAVLYRFEELDTVAPAYAISVHKAQGGEYPAVVIPLSLSQGAMLQRSLIYTAVTRGRSLVVIVGDPKALERAVRFAPRRLRWENLTEQLVSGFCSSASGDTDRNMARSAILHTPMCDLPGAVEKDQA